MRAEARTQNLRAVAQLLALLPAVPFRPTAGRCGGPARGSLRVYLRHLLPSGRKLEAPHAAHQRTGGNQLAVRRHGVSQPIVPSPQFGSVRVTVAALLFTRGVLCRGADHPRCRASRQASAAASGAAAADSQAPGPTAAFSRADFLRGADSSIYPGQAPAPAHA